MITEIWGKFQYKMLLVFFTVAALLGSIQGFTHEEANEYIETVLGDRFVEEVQYSRLEPYKLDDISLSLNVSGKKEGSATLSKGLLIHLSKVRRSADCTVPFWQFSNITFTCFLTFDHLRVNYTANATYGNMDVTFYPHVAIKGTNITIQVTSSPQDDVPSLNLLFINFIGNMNVTAEMISIGNLSRIVGPPVREALVTKTIQSLYKVLNGRFKSALAYSIYKTPIGFES